ncbi:hypothetical protein R3W88_033703 [Solanum pinnatisectum]|uniref:F-box associated domain-containing protein n=1 Tax=Solanum pinnatisectum TaxID=50273 RepID=A0AAV9K094_9SOLN|nr:hypothetical protein R3W88_033703 [Solanum pinnatisectum]
MYYKRSFYFPSILLSINDSIQLLVELKDDISHPLNKAILLSPGFHLPSPTFSKENMILIDSCNGFICLFNGSRNTVEHLVILAILFWKIIQRVAYAFCFSEASGQYKVLRSVVRKFAPEPLCGSLSNANVNGVVHWMNSEKSASIYSFNNWTEEVKSLFAPRGLKNFIFLLDASRVGELSMFCNNNHSQDVDIWWMKEYGIDKTMTNDRILKDIIQLNIRYGEILVQRDRGTQIVSYNPKAKKFTKVKLYLGFAATSYIPSFYLIKTIIGESFQVSYVYLKIEIL